LEERNEMSETPLILEAADGHASSALLLLEAGADVEAQQENKIGFTALNQAAYFGHSHVIQELINFRADVDTFDAYGGTPLVAAALNGEIDCVQALTEAGADINHTTTNGNTPLIKAAINGHFKCVKWLILKNADISIKNIKSSDAVALVKKQVEEKQTKLKELRDLQEPKRLLDLASGKKTPYVVSEGSDSSSVGSRVSSRRTSSGVSRNTKLLTKRAEKTVERFESAVKRLNEVLLALDYPLREVCEAWQKEFDIPS